MARSIRAPRYPFATSGKFGELVPVHRSIVAPGESMKRLKFQMRMQSKPIKNSLTGAYVDDWFFYVPIRHVWPEFADYITGDDTISPPESVASQRQFFQPSGDRSKLYALAYEQVVNGFFRSDEDDEYSVAPDVLAMAPRADLTGEFLSVEGLEALDETIDISDGLTISEIDDARATYRYKSRMAQASGSYADFLKMHGVNARQADVLQPESVGHVRSWVYPSKSVDQTNGFTVQSYFADVKARFDKSRYFPEHGYIVGVASVRPKIYLREGQPYEDTFKGPHQWPHKGQQAQDRLLTRDAWLTGVPSPQDQSHYVDHFLLHGRQNVGVVQETAHRDHDPVNFASLRVPPDHVYTSMLTQASDWTADAHFAVDGVVSESFATPLSLTLHS